MILLGAFQLRAETVHLRPEQIRNAVCTEEISIPTPGELFTALARSSKPNWQNLYRKPIPIAFTSRPQIALNLGGLLADGHIAVRAEDSQQVKNINKDLMALAKSLGVSDNVLRRGSSITDFAEKNQWQNLQKELDSTQNEIRLAMQEMHDTDLVSLVTFGAWIRGTEAATDWIAANYSPQAAKLLRQPAIAAFLQQTLLQLPEKIRAEKMMSALEKDVHKIQELSSFPNESTPGPEQVKALLNAFQELTKNIADKK